MQSDVIWYAICNGLKSNRIKIRNKSVLMFLFFTIQVIKFAWTRRVFIEILNLIRWKCRNIFVLFIFVNPTTILIHLICVESLVYWEYSDLAIWQSSWTSFPPIFQNDGNPVRYLSQTHPQTNYVNCSIYLFLLFSSFRLVFYSRV